MSQSTPTKYWLNMAKWAAVAHSHDAETQTGCVLVAPSEVDDYIFGANIIPRDIAVTDDRTHRPEKYDWIGHAEIVTIGGAARSGWRTDRATAYQNCLPCIVCAHALAAAGIIEVHVAFDQLEGDPARDQALNVRYRFDEAREFLKAAGIPLTVHKEIE